MEQLHASGPLAHGSRAWPPCTSAASGTHARPRSTAGGPHLRSSLSCYYMSVQLRHCCLRASDRRYIACARQDPFQVNHN